MAIQIGYTTPDTVNHSEAYVKCIHFQVDIIRTKITATYGIWHNAVARDGDHPAGTIKILHFELESVYFDSLVDPLVTAIYNYSKNKVIEDINFEGSINV